jgi:hypothetical protein
MCNEIDLFKYIVKYVIIYITLIKEVLNFTILPIIIYYIIILTVLR